jgi:hypothetical protein
LSLDLKRSLFFYHGYQYYYSGNASIHFCGWIIGLMLESTKERWAYSIVIGFTEQNLYVYFSCHLEWRTDKHIQSNLGMGKMNNNIVVLIYCITMVIWGTRWDLNDPARYWMSSVFGRKLLAAYSIICWETRVISLLWSMQFQIVITYTVLWFQVAICRETIEWFLFFGLYYSRFQIVISYTS